MKITFIGGGNMASALISGLLKQGYTTNQIGVVEINEESRARMKEVFGITAVDDLKKGIAISEPDAADNVIVLAVKPQQLHGLSQQLAGLLNQQLVISIAAGIRTADIMRWLGGYKRIIRTMPNTNGLQKSRQAFVTLWTAQAPSWK